MAIALLAVAACAGDDRAVGRSEPVRQYGIGRPATSAEVAAVDVDISPNGAGLPAGRGTVTQGQAIYARQCASCHGANGEGAPPLYPPLIGRPPAAENFAFGTNPMLPRTIDNYWPYATAVFDYVRRAMPLDTPGSLTDDEVYAVTAYLLAANQVIPMTATLDSASLVAVKMPYVDRFVPDDRRGGREIR